MSLSVNSLVAFNSGLDIFEMLTVDKSLRTVAVLLSCEEVVGAK